jgi:hypothetical protein
VVMVGGGRWWLVVVVVVVVVVVEELEALGGGADGWRVYLLCIDKCLVGRGDKFPCKTGGDDRYSSGVRGSGKWWWWKCKCRSEIE